jgi:hypothetical protein
MDTTKLAQEQIGWRWIAAALVLAVFLAGALMMSVAAQISHPADTQHPTPSATTASDSNSSNAHDPGNFAWGYVEFDQDPKAPGGIPGFDHWPPVAPRQR